jgi:hypothetical protein
LDFLHFCVLVFSPIFATTAIISFASWVFHTFISSRNAINFNECNDMKNNL